MIGGASVEDMLTLWASSLREAKQRMRPLFTQERVAISAGQFFDGLLGNEPRKTGWRSEERRVGKECTVLGRLCAIVAAVQLTNCGLPQEWNT